ncbi:MAG: y domain 1, partial [Verrucomicrobiota bacterium]
MLAVLLMAAIPVPFLRGEEAVRLWQLVGGKHFRASFVSEAGGKVTLRRKDDGKTVTVTRDELMPADTIYLDDLAKAAKPSGGGTGPAAATGGGSDEALPSGEPGKNRLYPRTREEIRAGLREIQSRKKPDKVEGEVWAAICRLNEHRFLA